MSQTPVIVAAQRTPIALAGRGLREFEVDALSAAVLRSLRESEPHDLPLPADIIIGMARGPGGNPARSAALAAGWPIEVPAVTLDRQCGAGLDAVCFAAAEIAAGNADHVIAGGAESATHAPPGRSRFAPVDFGDPDMGPAAEALAGRAGISRERQDAYALRSHQRALEAVAAGRFEPELVPGLGLDHDERIRDMSPRLLARMPAAFADDGTVTAGNSCPVSDGAAAVTLITEDQRDRLGIPGLAIRAWARAGVDPQLPGIGPVPAVTQALQRSAIGIGDLDRIEITEAFAAQVLAVTERLGIPDDDPRLCADGGAIALGHPWGASGAVLVVRLFTSLVRQRRGRWGLATCAIGGGQGIAVVVERVGP